MIQRYLILFLCLGTFLQANLPKDITVEGRVSYFIPSSSLLREIFDGGAVDYELIGTVPLYKQWNLFWGVEYLQNSGRALGQPVKTSLWMVPLTLGLKWLFYRAPYTPYFGAGMKYYFVHVHNNANYLKRNIFRQGLGGIIEAGILTLLRDHFIIDVFASCSIKNFSASGNSLPNTTNTRLSVGGWNMGAGLGYQF